MFEGVNKGSLVLKGDLLKPKSWNSPINIQEVISLMVVISGISMTNYLS